MAASELPTPSKDPVRLLEGILNRLQLLRESGSIPDEHDAAFSATLNDLDRLRSMLGVAQNTSRDLSDWQYERSFRSLVNNAPDMIARMDWRHRFLYVNPAAGPIIGVAVGDLLGKAISELELPPHIVSLCERNLTQVLEGGKPTRFRFDTEIQATHRFFDVRLAPEMGAGAEVASVLAVVREITDLEQARQSLQRYASRLHFLHRVSKAVRSAHSVSEIAEAALPFSQGLLDCARASVALFDRAAGETVIVAVSTDRETRLAAGARFRIEWKWLLTDLEQGEICQIEDLSSLQPRSESIQLLLDEGIRSLIVVPLVVQDRLIGSLNLGMSSYEPLTDETAEIAREMADHLAIAIHQADLHQRVQGYAELLEESVVERTAELRASEARFRTIFEDAALGIALVDKEGVILSSNPTLQQMLGYSARELEGMNVDQFIHPDDIGPRNAFFRELLSGKRSQFRMERRYIRKDGHELWVRPTVSMIRSGQDDGRYAIKMVEDITEEKRMREALIRSDRLSVAGRLGASLAHEISNPLQAVIGSLGLAAEMLEPESQVLPYLEIATEELERAADIVGQLRNLNRPSEPGEKRLSQINEIVEKVLILNKKRCENQQVRVEWTPDSDVPAAVMVSDRIRQVFLNLVFNAVDAMPEGGRLHVSTTRTRSPGGVDIEFADSGSGIDADLLPRIFEPFQSNRPGGMGLGLYISKTIVEEHGGRISVDSRLGQGTTFTVWLPFQTIDEDRTGVKDG